MAYTVKKSLTPLRRGHDYIYPPTVLSQVKMDDDLHKSADEVLIRNDQDVLTLEEIQASSPEFLAGKVPSAEAIKQLNSDIPFKFGIDENGNYGFIKDGADSVTPFNTSNFWKNLNFPELGKPILFGADTTRQARYGDDRRFLTVDENYFEVVDVTYQNKSPIRLYIKAKSSFSLYLLGGFYMGTFGFEPLQSTTDYISYINTTYSIIEGTVYILYNARTNDNEAASAIVIGFLYKIAQ